jgi:NhaP-type Na+/H+ or K+/H+ antiporter
MGVWMVILTILNLNIARFLNITIITFFVNKTRDDNKVTPKFQFIMWVSGLRGAMAYALALKCSIDFPIGPVILIDTLIYSFLSIVVLGSFITPIVDKCDVKRKEILPGMNTNVAIT